MSSKSGFDAVIEVGRQVGDLVGEVDQLRFERRTLVEEVRRELGVSLRSRSRGSA